MVSPARGFRLALWTLLVIGGAAAVTAQQAEGPRNAVYQVDIDGVINPGNLRKLEHAIARAEAASATVLVVRIDTPGGLLSTTRDMVSAISQARVPVVGYVGPSGASATSAGAFLLLATHVASMNVGTNVGAATPVTGSGEDIPGAMGSKILNDTRAFMRSIAESRGRDVQTAESFVTDATSLSAGEALSARVIDLVVDDAEGLIVGLDGLEFMFHGTPARLQMAGATVEPVPTRFIDSMLIHLAHPQIAHMLIALGSLAIYIEILSPGLTLPGVLGVISVILGLVCLQTLPVNTGFQILLLLGIGLMIAEYFVAGFGVLGIGGAAAFIVGSLYLFDEPVLPDYRDSVLPVSIAIAAVMAITSVLVGSNLFSGWRSQRLEGLAGEAVISFDKTGFVHVAGKRWPAETLEPLQSGDRIVVVQAGADGRLTVKRARG
jgi:membrane-bound serine protease (ClpP class)